MTVMYADTGMYLLDVFRSMGLGMLLCLIYTPLRRLRGGVFSVLLHIMAGTLAGWLTCFFICGVTYCRSPRWFLFLGIAVGWSACAVSVLPYVAALAKTAGSIIGFLYSVFTKLFAPLFGVLTKMTRPLCAHLKNRWEILYNLIKKKTQPPRGTPDGTETHKEPIKAIKAP